MHGAHGPPKRLGAQGPKNTGPRDPEAQGPWDPRGTGAQQPRRPAAQARGGQATRTEEHHAAGAPANPLFVSTPLFFVSAFRPLFVLGIFPFSTPRTQGVRNEKASLFVGFLIV